MNILRNIPGFRSKKTWKMITALIYYVISVLMAFAGPSMSLFFISLPFFIFSLIDVAWHKKKGIPIKKALIPLILSFFLIVGALSMPLGISNDSQISKTDKQEGTKSEETIKKDTEEKDISKSEQGNRIKDDTDLEEEDNGTTSESKNATEVGGELEVHFIDVGQADSILIKTSDGHSMLIDAGNNADDELVYSYLKNEGVKILDVVVGTHPHEDHIGGLDTVINNFNVNKVYMPKASNTTKTYEDVLLAIKNKGLKVTNPVVGSTFSLGDAKFTILAPNSSNYNELNNYSIVLKMEYGSTSFLFTGDAEDISEEEMINKGYDLSVDLLKVAHHGSESSTTESFLKAVSPKYAVIMVGKDNSYGHPHKKVLTRLKNHNIEVYRTDESGTIIATTDGNSVSINKSPSAILLTEPPVSSTKPVENTKPSNNNQSADNTLSNSDKQNDDFDNTGNEGVIIQNIDKEGEIITIKNNSSSSINLKGWKIVSVTGNQTFVFPDYTLAAGASVTVASGDVSGDLIWGKANIWNNSKSDPGELYDSSGNLVYRYDD